MTRADRSVRLAIDTNVLIYAHIPAFKEHEAVRRLLTEQLRSPEVSIVLTPLVLHEFVHVVTDARRFQPPVQMAEAMAVAREYLGRRNVECIACDQEALSLAFELLERHSLGRGRIADTLLAATLLHHGVTKLITCNTRDFEVFGALALVDPLDVPRSENPSGGH